MKRDEDLPARRESPSDFLIYQTEGGATKIEVRLEDETVWLTQRLMAELFQKDVRTINDHISNVYEESELAREATIRKYRIVQRRRGTRGRPDGGALQPGREAARSESGETQKAKNRLRRFRRIPEFGGLPLPYRLDASAFE